MSESSNFSAAPVNPALAPDRWQQGELVELTITDLSDRGDGVGRYGQRVVFVPDTVTGDRAQVRLVRVKPQYAHGKLHTLLEPSPHRIRPQCIVADKCGGCQWQHVAYDYQLQAKQNLVVQALERIGGFTDIPLRPMLHAERPLDYRNKATYPLGLSQATGDTEARVVAGYYQKGSHQIVNLNQCPIQDVRLNPLLAEIKQDVQARGWPIYDETKHRGLLRHLALRVGRRTGEQLLTLVVRHWDLPGIEAQAQIWQDRYPDLVGVLLNRNGARTNAIFGRDTRCLAGRPYLQEQFAGLIFQIRPDTFFQVNTEVAEQVVETLLATLALTGTETVIDAYCGVGTLSLPLAQRSRQVIGLENQVAAVEQADLNALLNEIQNVSFQVGQVRDLLPALGVQPDVVVLDPPRKGCDRAVLETLQARRPPRIVYMSCNPATLARDLKILCANGDYHLTQVQPADFFPQTAHVECLAFLSR